MGLATIPSVMPDYYEVVLFRRTELRLTYAAPAGENGVVPGALVSVPVGGRFENGIVWREVEAGDLDPARIRPITRVVESAQVLDRPLRELSEWIAAYYDALLGTVLENMVPAVVRRGIQPKMDYRLVRLDPIGGDGVERLKKRAPKQYRLWEFLGHQPAPVAESALRETFPGLGGLVKGLVAKGLVRREPERRYRDAYLDEEVAIEGAVTASVAVEPPQLRPQQDQAVRHLTAALGSGGFGVSLLYGVTGSGKTEVYVRAILETCRGGRSVIVLVPEITLAPQTVARVRGRCESAGIGVVVWHSHLSDGERYDAWQSLVTGRAKVVVGARSAVFAPVRDLGLMIVDEEHEGAYKQEDSPRYHARDVAVYRAMLEGAVCVLGSATPSLETMRNAESGKYDLLRLAERVDAQPLPTVQVVDMRVEARRRDSHPLFSHLLIEKVRGRLAQKEQTILFLNRRGFSRSIQCPDCGEAIQCPHCAIAMTFHRETDSLMCHLCGREDPVPPRCPNCGSINHRRKGFGTEQVEGAARDVFRNARIVRLDADTMKRKNLYRSILHDFRIGRIDILIGTQMVAKGLDFPNVTLVGVIDADTGLHLEDFRAPERTFHLLVQVSGRAGRGDAAGEVVIQSRTPHAPSIQYARRTEVDAFYEAEIAMRRDFAYPPFRHLARHLFLSRNEQKASFAAEAWVRAMERLPEGAFPAEVRGPVVAPIARIRDEYRYQVWYFTNHCRRLVAAIRGLRTELKLPPGVREILDVDAYSLH